MPRKSEYPFFDTDRFHHTSSPATHDVSDLATRQEASLSYKWIDGSIEVTNRLKVTGTITRYSQMHAEER
jgi:hypothetical protein